MKIKSKLTPPTVLSDSTLEAMMDEHSCNSFRIIHQNEFYSMDYVGNRLNIEVDEDKRVKRVWVG